MTDQAGIPKTLRAAMIDMIMKMGKLLVLPSRIGLPAMQYRTLAIEFQIYDIATEEITVEVSSHKVTFYLDKSAS